MKDLGLDPKQFPNTTRGWSNPATVQPIPQNKVMGAVASGLRKARSGVESAPNANR